MPIYQRKDKDGNFFQYGNSGKKYYFEPFDHQSKVSAYFKSYRQSKAIHSKKYNLKLDFD